MSDTDSTCSDEMIECITCCELGAPDDTQNGYCYRCRPCECDRDKCKVIGGTCAWQMRKYCEENKCEGCCSCKMDSDSDSDEED